MSLFLCLEVLRQIHRHGRYCDMHLKRKTCQDDPQILKDLDLSQRRDRHTLLLVVHQDSLQRNRVAFLPMNGLMNLSVNKLALARTGKLPRRAHTRRYLPLV